MAVNYDLAQVQGTASVSTYATLYTAPADAIVSTISVCNTASAAATYRIGIMATEGTPGAANWVTYDSSIAANDTVFLTTGMVIPSGYYVRVSSSADTVTFHASVSEIS
jgi:hypothetical protein